MEERLEAAGGELLAAVANGVATVTLNRPAAHNALTLGMIRGLAAWMEAWAADPSVKLVVFRGAGGKAFCAGGDVRALYEGWNAGQRDQLEFFTPEYALNYRIHTYPKPIVAVMDGIIMGGGMGLAQGAALRIATDKTRMGMPETAIGLFPDVGGTWFLSKCPGKVGTYLGLVGPTIRAADALYARLADAYLAPDALASLDAEFAAAAAATDPRAAVAGLAQRLASAPPGAVTLEPIRQAIDVHFGHVELGRVKDSLQGALEPDPAAWTAKAQEALAKHSPTMLAVTLEQLVRGPSLSLAEVFRMELGMVATALEQGDFMEGVRALLVSKDNNPRWNPPTISDIDPAVVARFFAPRWTADQHPLRKLGSATF